MPSPLRLWVRAAAFLLSTLAVSRAPAAEAGKLLPGDADVILTLNLRQILDDHKNTELVQRYLEPWRLALKADEAVLKKFYRDRDLLKTEGITEKDFLHRTGAFRSVNDNLGIDLLTDVRRITCAFKVGELRSLMVLVEGNFKPVRFPTAIKQLAVKHFGSFKRNKVGEVEIWQVPEDGSGVFIALLDDKTLAITGSRGGIDDLLARSMGNKAGLSAGLQTLLAGCEKEHVGLVVNKVDAVADEAARFLEVNVVKGLDANDLAGTLALTQAAGLVRKYGADFSAVSLGLSLGTEDVRLQFGAEAKKAERAAELGKQAQIGNLAAGLALKTVDNALAKQLADVLLRVRVAVKDTTIVVRVTVPHEFVKTVVNSSWLDPAMLGNPLVDRAVRRVMSVRLWGPANPPPPGALEVETVRDVAYWDDPKADPIRNGLDLYVPRGKKGYPVVVFVHGGAWTIGDNRCCGLYGSVGDFLASQGIGAVLPNYRLSPRVKHPEHARDVARAVAWTRGHIARHGGDPARIHLAGHSAGAHIVSLLATDESYLREVGMKSTDIGGVIAMSGAYHIRHGAVFGTLGGPGSLALRADQFYPVRGDSVPLPDVPLPGLPLQWNVYGPIFGDDPKERDNASPVNHVRRGLPPFLILEAEHDLPTITGMGEEFHRALVREGCNSRLIQVEKRNHNSIIFSAIKPDDPVGGAIVEFVKK
jgi:acetyl esterase/lipase